MSDLRLSQNLVDQLNFRDDEIRQQEVEDISLFLDKIGLHKLAGEVRHEIFLARLLDANLLANRWEFESDFLQRREDKIQGIVTDWQTRAFDKSQSYNNFIVTLGYAGFFAIWNFTNNSLADLDRAVIALFLGFSLLTFILWTLFQSLQLSVITRKSASILAKPAGERDQFLEDWEKHTSRVNKITLNSMRLYPIAFFLSAVPAFLAGIMLLTLLGGQVAGAPFSFQSLLNTTATEPQLNTPPQ